VFFFFGGGEWHVRFEWGEGCRGGGRRFQGREAGHGGQVPLDQLRRPVDSSRWQLRACEVRIQGPVVLSGLQGRGRAVSLLFRPAEVAGVVVMAPGMKYGKRRYASGEEGWGGGGVKGPRTGFADLSH
jgi:hypothetical protein